MKRHKSTHRVSNTPVIVLGIVSVITIGGIMFTMKTNKESSSKGDFLTPPSQQTYVCPANGWVDCKRGSKPKVECTSTVLEWIKSNCPNFKGVTN
jgi:hypothetical protein